MPHVDAHKPGTINWVDTVSTDLEAASPFYVGLFGWEPEDMAMPGGDGTYRFFRLGGRDAAAAGTMPAEMAAQGIPSHWNVWVAGNADEATDKAAAAGGQVLMAPTTLGPSGRLAMVTDPGGAAIGVWQADQHIGAGVVHEPGAMTWWEVNTRAFEDCRRFYGQVFGWDAEPLDDPVEGHGVARPDSIGHAGSPAHSSSEPSYTATSSMPRRVSSSASLEAAIPAPQ